MFMDYKKLRGIDLHVFNKIILLPQSSVYIPEKNLDSFIDQSNTELVKIIQPHDINTIKCPRFITISPHDPWFYNIVGFRS